MHYKNGREDWRSDEIALKLNTKEVTLLVDALAIAGWVVCAGDDCEDEDYRERMRSLVQRVLRLVMSTGRVDGVWKNPEDGSLNHSDFEMQRGPAWRATELFCDESFWIELPQRLSLQMAEREGLEGEEMQESAQRYEAHLQEVFEQSGLSQLVLAPSAQAG